MTNMAFKSFLICAILLSGCKNDEVDFAKMDAAEKSFNERQRNNLVIFMPLETMFPDQQVRLLAKAAGNGKVDQVEALAGQGVDVNSRGKANATPLIWAMREGNVVGFKKLLELGADPNVIFDDGGTVMHWAVEAESMDFLSLALQHGGNPNLAAGQELQTPMFDAIGLRRKHDLMVISLLLSQGADPDFKDWQGNTPLIHAAVVSRFDIVYELLEAGADYTIKNDSGHDLANWVAQDVGSFVSGSPQEKELQKVITWLSERGVRVREEVLD